MITIVHGPAACGKTRNKNLLRDHFGSERILDGWDARTGWIDHGEGPIRDGDLILTCAPPQAIRQAKSLREHHPRRVQIVSFDDAMQAAGAKG